VWTLLALTVDVLGLTHSLSVSIKAHTVQPASTPRPLPLSSQATTTRPICMCRSSRCHCYNNMPVTPYLGNVDLPTMSPYPTPPWNHQQLPVVDGYNRYSNPYPTPSPTLPGTPSRLPPTPNSPPSSLPSSPRLRIDASLMHGYYDASNEYHMLSDRSLLNAAVDQYTSSLVLVLPQDLNASDIIVTPTTSSPYITAFDVVAAIRKALYMPSQRWGEPSHRRLVDSLRGNTRISVRGRQAGPRPVLTVEFS
jgi:hypothetical protein